MQQCGCEAVCVVLDRTGPDRTELYRTERDEWAEGCVNAGDFKRQTFAKRARLQFFFPCASFQRIPLKTEISPQRRLTEKGSPCSASAHSSLSECFSHLSGPAPSSSGRRLSLFLGECESSRTPPQALRPSAVRSCHSARVLSVCLLCILFFFKCFYFHIFCCNTLTRRDAAKALLVAVCYEMTCIDSSV